ncbi:hypothetical protein [Bradyrhizobium neotropicale]|uniref:hypothetical protein n=1 Tax=Bradyrhizobium neotropicale TaxID=1497615 RepID=UPI001AD67909|nr:hypothetical protein [Bradyrhizobium neotropicale]MBO4228364.1 hypothetical protein [Bradyrhizobium neotropicale]
MTKKHFIGKTSQVPWSTCTGCGKEIGAASAIDDDSAVPKAGNITVCMFCGLIMAFADDLTLRDLTHAETIEVASDDRIIALQRSVAMKP